MDSLNKAIGMVVAADINPDALNETVEIAGKNPRLFTEVVDISNKEVVFAFAKNAIEKYGKVDGIINNAGIISMEKKKLRAYIGKDCNVMKML